MLLAQRFFAQLPALKCQLFRFLMIADIGVRSGKIT